MVDIGFTFLFMLLAFFNMHVVFFGIEVVLSLIMLGMLIWHIRKPDSEIKKEIKVYLNYIIMTYSSAHFFLTATTVLALTFFPGFLALAGKILFYPLMTLILLLILRLGMLTFLWYGWDKYEDTTYHTVAFGLFALAGVLMLYVDMVLLSFMNVPQGLEAVDPLIVNNGKLWVNSTLLPLLLTIVFSAVAVTLFALVFNYAYKIKNNHEKSELFKKLKAPFLNLGFISYALFVPSLFWYIFALRKHSPHKYANIVGFVFGETTPADGINLGAVFLIALIVAVLYLVLSGFVFYKNYKGELDLGNKNYYWMTLALAPLMAIIFEVVFFLNFIGQTPYFVVAPDAGVAVLTVDGAVNNLAADADLYLLSGVVFIPYIAIFGSLLYLTLFRIIGGKGVPEKTADQL